MTDTLLSERFLLFFQLLCCFSSKSVKKKHFISVFELFCFSSEFFKVMLDPLLKNQNWIQMVSLNWVPDLMFYLSGFFFFFLLHARSIYKCSSELVAEKSNQTKQTKDFHIRSSQDVETSGCFRITENQNTLPMAEFGLNTQNLTDYHSFVHNANRIFF